MSVTMTPISGGISTEDIDTYLSQYNANLDWETSTTKANAALQALRWILVNRPQTLGSSTRNLNYASLENEMNSIVTFLRGRVSRYEHGNIRVAEF